MTRDEEAVYVREVATQKTAALRMSLDAVERQGMPFVGETGGVGPGGAGSGGVGPGGVGPGEVALGDAGPGEAGPVVDRAPDRAGLPMDPGLAERLEAARREADTHRHHGERRAPRPDRMRR